MKKKILRITAIYFFSLLVIFLTSVRFWGNVPVINDEHGFFTAGKILFSGKNHIKEICTQPYLEVYIINNPYLGVYLLGLLHFIATKIQSILSCFSTILLMRIAMAILSATNVLLFSFITYIIISPRASIISPCLLLFSPIFRSTQVTILQEVFMCFFFLLTILLSLYWYKYKSKIQIESLIYCAIIGLSTGFAISCKLYAVILIPIIFIVFFNLADIEVSLGRIIVVITFCGIIFIVTNPLLYFDFGNGLRALSIEHINIFREYNYKQLKDLALYPFIIFDFRLRHLMIFPLNKTEYIFIVIGYLALIKSFQLIWKRRNKSIIIVWFLSTFLLFGMILAAARPGWADKGKYFLLPNMVFVFCVTFFVDDLFHHLITAWSKLSILSHRFLNKRS